MSTRSSAHGLACFAGGSADLLAATLLLDAVEQGQYDIQADLGDPEGGF
jgi:hypothetical protein